MGKLKKFTIGSGIALIALSGLTAIWYREHYSMPHIRETRVALPSPNGFDTLQAAMKLTVMEKDGITVLPKHVPDSSPPRDVTYSLADRLKLTRANEAAIAKTREALEQEYCIPPHGSGNFEGMPTRDQARMLAFAGDAYADSGNLPEAARCYLDVIELCVMLPDGGGIMAFYYGTVSEALGNAALGRVLDRLDAQTVHAVAERLGQIEQKRTPFSEVLYQENHNLHHEVAKLFTSNPLTAWKNIGQGSAQTDELTYSFEASQALDSGEELEPPSFADRAQLALMKTVVTYQGPGPTIAELDRGMSEAVTQSELPWGPQRPPLKEPGYNLIARLIGPVYTLVEFKDRQTRTRMALLQARVQLRAAFLETGRYPAKPANLPTDPFSPTRSPLGYRSNGKTFTLWSVGPDAKDDNGRPLKSTTWYSGSMQFESGDVVAGINK